MGLNPYKYPLLSTHSGHLLAYTRKFQQKTKTMAKPFLLLSLLLLVSSTTTVFCQSFNSLETALPPHNYHGVAPAHAPSHHHHDHHHHHLGHPPTLPPVHPPALSPVHPPKHHHHHDHAPSHAPVHPPLAPPKPYHPPVQPPPKPYPEPHPPAHPPVHPPEAHPHPHPHPHEPVPRSFVAVQGVVYCKSCKYAGVDTLLNATAVFGATVKLECKNTKYPLVVQSKTDKNGYFYITAPKSITSFGAHKCKVSLVSSPNAACSQPSNLHYGAVGAPLRPEKKFTDDHGKPFILYTVGPFAFEPKCPK